MKSSGVKPIGNTARSGAWSDSKAMSQSAPVTRTRESSFQETEKHGKVDTVSFSELMRTRRQVEGGTAADTKEDEMAIFMKIISNSNDKIREMARSKDAANSMRQLFGYASSGLRVSAPVTEPK